VGARLCVAGRRGASPCTSRYPVSARCSALASGSSQRAIRSAHRQEAFWPNRRAGTLGGLAAGLLGERVAAVLGIAAMLPILAALNLLCAWLIRRFAATENAPGRFPCRRHRPGTVIGKRRVRVCGSSRRRDTFAISPPSFSWNAGAALMEYVFKVQAVAAFARAKHGCEFFAIYYAAVSLITFVVQTSSSRLVLEKLGLAVSSGTPSMALLAEPRAPSRAGPGQRHRGQGRRIGFPRLAFPIEATKFSTPDPAPGKRAAKSLIDVGFDRLGDAHGWRPDSA